MKKWFKSHTALAIILGIPLAWIVYRALKGTNSAGHANPQDAISYGWSVYQAGITGWLEVSPDGKTQVTHDTGWTGDPYATT